MKKNEEKTKEIYHEKTERKKMSKTNMKINLEINNK